MNLGLIFLVPLLVFLSIGNDWTLGMRPLETREGCPPPLPSQYNHIIAMRPDSLVLKQGFHHEPLAEAHADTKKMDILCPTSYSVHNAGQLIGKPATRG